MLSRKLIVFVFLSTIIIIIMSKESTATPIKRGAAAAPGYTVEHIVEHAYASETSMDAGQNRPADQRQVGEKPSTQKQQNQPEPQPQPQPHPHPKPQPQPQPFSVPVPMEHHHRHHQQQQQQQQQPLAMIGATTNTTKPWQHAMSNGPIGQIITNFNGQTVPSVVNGRNVPMGQTLGLPNGQNGHNPLNVEARQNLLDVQNRQNAPNLQHHVRIGQNNQNRQIVPSSQNIGLLNGQTVPNGQNTINGQNIHNRQNVPNGHYLSNGQSVLNMQNVPNGQPVPNRQSEHNRETENQLNGQRAVTPNGQNPPIVPNIINGPTNFPNGQNILNNIPQNVRNGAQNGQINDQNLANGESASTNDQQNALPTERSLAAFLAMLEETRQNPDSETDSETELEPETNRNRKREQPKFTPEFPPSWTIAGVSTPTTTPTTTKANDKNDNGALAAVDARHDADEPDWSVYDRLDTREPNQTAAVMESEQKFGYVVNNDDHQRFRVEGKSSNGLITGLFGFHHNNGNIRGVQYTADPSINPKFLYDTLMKFISS